MNMLEAPNNGVDKFLAKCLNLHGWCWWGWDETTRNLHWFLGGRVVAIQQGTNVRVGLPSPC